MPLDLPNLDVMAYCLPADGPAAREAFLALLHSPGETWIIAYAMTQLDLLNEIEQADAAGVPVHLLIDHSQSAGSVERPIIAAVAQRLKHGDITISTAGPDSKSPYEILHSKLLITAGENGKEDWIWSGSVNMSNSGWLQGNTATLFRSTAWARQVLIPNFERTRAWALAHIPQLAPAPVVVAAPVGSVTVTLSGGPPSQ